MWLNLLIRFIHHLAPPTRLHTLREHELLSALLQVASLEDGFS